MAAQGRHGSVVIGLLIGSARPSVRSGGRQWRQASHFIAETRKKSKSFFFFSTALVEFLRGQFGLCHPSKLDFSFCSRIDFFLSSLLLLGILGNYFFAPPWTCFYVSFPLIRRLFFPTRPTERRGEETEEENTFPLVFSHFVFSLSSSSLRLCILALLSFLFFSFFQSPDETCVAQAL